MSNLFFYVIRNRFRHIYHFFTDIFGINPSILWNRVARGKWQTMVDELKHWWENTVAPKDYKVIPANSYPVLCTLEERISLGSGFVRYKFRLPEPDLVSG